MESKYLPRASIAWSHGVCHECDSHNISQGFRVLISLFSFAFEFSIFRLRLGLPRDRVFSKSLISSDFHWYQ
ncbi:hypothetical protein H5410_047151 [Solanum commersonii]|uniref:Uncharacterized protein n=1 Tax=Solanum commersonii TaxID=4109 RepID=A0A9J5XGA0_SOLCO|nr:hypothetical protein H5410_047151 [Solanum commersonii]